MRFLGVAHPRGLPPIGLQDLNQLQNNASVLDAIRKSGGRMNERSLPEMRDHCRRIGYEPADFDALNPIHVTGTKGKGSTCALTESILRRYPKPGGNGATLRTGLYTSPHLMAVRERIRINGALLSKEKFTKYFYDVWDMWNDLDQQQVLPLSEDALPQKWNPRPTYFRFLTLVAFHAFMQEKAGGCYSWGIPHVAAKLTNDSRQVDVAVIEVGVGGQYDSTNVLVHPIVCGVTNLGLDHCSVLGKTVSDIAWHKSGIFKVIFARFLRIVDAERCREDLFSSAVASMHLISSMLTMCTPCRRRKAYLR
ncbi:MAG: folylpolyglutamate synthase [Olpidium bornovanus]|uniref:Folylpolyglutamate synthase n=1 Tax=Olpidium bornovanus TaxID=278681 RepID=A0A8H7ZPW3_9FUNG|nr:MAG: folylpolyglutamate synthase [Olpidium bornovanus]